MASSRPADQRPTQPEPQHAASSRSAGTQVTVSTGRAAVAAASATLAADGFGLSPEKAAAVGGIAGGVAVAIDVAGSVANLRPLRRRPSGDELAFREGLREWLTALGETLAKHQDHPAWLESKLRRIDQRLEEATTAAGTIKDDRLQTALRRLKDDLDRSADFELAVIPGELNEHIADAIVATNINDRGALVVPEPGRAKQWWLKLKRVRGR